MVIGVNLLMAGRTSYTIFITDDLLNKAQVVAELENRSFNNFIENCIFEHLWTFQKEHGEITLDQIKKLKMEKSFAKLESNKKKKK